jgi:hypothetical protein
MSTKNFILFVGIQAGLATILLHQEIPFVNLYVTPSWVDHIARVATGSTTM